MCKNSIAWGTCLKCFKKKWKNFIYVILVVTIVKVLPLHGKPKNILSSYSKYSSPFLVFISLISLLPPPGMCNQAVFKKLILRAVKCQVSVSSVSSVPSKPWWKREAFHLLLFILLLLLTCISAYWPRGIPIDFSFQGLTCLLKSWVCFRAKSVPKSHRISLPRETCCRENSTVTSPVVSQTSPRHLYLPGRGRTSAWDKLTALWRKLQSFLSQSYFVTN